MNSIEQAAQGTPQPAPTTGISAAAAGNAVIATIVFSLVKQLLDTNAIDAEKLVRNIESFTSDMRKDPAVDRAVVQAVEVIQSMRPSPGDANG